MNKSTLCTHLGCIISYDRNDSPGCISKGCAMTRAVPATMAEYKLPLPDGLQITDADRKAWGYDRCTSCGHKLYSEAHHSCPKPLRDALTRGVKKYVDPDKFHSHTEGDRTYHIRKLPLMDDPNVNESGPKGAKRPLTAHEALTDTIKVEYLSKKNIEVVQRPKPWFPRYPLPDDACIRFMKTEPLLTLAQLTYRILAQIPLPGQPLYSNQYNLPL